MPAQDDSIRFTLRLDRRTAEVAQRFAQAKGTSVERLVTRFLDTLTDLPEPGPAAGDDWQAELSPATRRLLERAEAPEVNEEDRHRWLTEKHG